MSTFTDPDVKAAQDAYGVALGDVIRALRSIADAADKRLIAFDDDGHFRHLDDATGVVSNVLRQIPHLGLARLMEAAAAADQAIDRARLKALDNESR